MAADAHGPSIGPSVAEILASHAAGTGSPTKTAARVADAIAARGDDGTWLSTVPRERAARRRRGDREAPRRADSAALRRPVRGQGQHRRGRRRRPRWRAPTTPTSPTTTAPVVQRLLDAGALYVGKTSLDQFATGLNGTRTPYTDPAQRVRRRPDLRRLEFGLGAGRGAGPGAVRGGHRHRGLGTGARRAQRRRRVQAVARADQHRRARAGVQVAGLHQPDGGLRSTTSTASSTWSPAATTTTPGRATAGHATTAVPDPGRPAAGRGAGVLRRRPRCAARTWRFRSQLARHGDRRRGARWSRSWPRARCSTRAPGWPSGSSSSATSWPRTRTRSTPWSAEIFEGGRELHRGRRVRGAAAAGRSSRPQVGRLWQTDGRAGGADDRHHLHRRRGAGRPGRPNTTLGHYTHFGNLLDLLGVAVPPGTTRRRPALQRDAARRRPDRRHRAAARRAAARRTARAVVAPRPTSPATVRGAPVNQPVEVPAEPSPFRAVAGKTALSSSTCSATSCCPGGFGETLGNDVSQLPAGRTAAGRAAVGRPRRRGSW